MTYAIEGRHCELLRVELADGERVIAEVGTLVYLRGVVEWHVVFPGRGRRRHGRGRFGRPCGAPRPPVTALVPSPFLVIP